MSYLFSTTSLSFSPEQSHHTANCQHSMTSFYLQIKASHYQRTMTSSDQQTLPLLSLCQILCSVTQLGAARRDGAQRMTAPACESCSPPPPPRPQPRLAGGPVVSRSHRRGKETLDHHQRCATSPFAARAVA